MLQIFAKQNRARKPQKVMPSSLILRLYRITLFEQIFLMIFPAELTQKFTAFFFAYNLQKSLIIFLGNQMTIEEENFGFNAIFRDDHCCNMIFFAISGNQGIMLVAFFDCPVAHFENP